MVSNSTRHMAQAIQNKINGGSDDYQKLSDLLDVSVHAFEDEKDPEWALKVTKYIKSYCEYDIRKMKDNIADPQDVILLDDLNWKTLRVEAPYWFESYLYYMERNRKPEKKFYVPRQRTLHIVAMDLQELEENKLEIYGLSMPPRVGKSTLCIFFISWVIGRHPSSHNAMSGHSGILADRFYNDTYKLTESDEYTFHEIFPKLNPPKTSAEKNELSYDKSESFATLTCRGIDGTWTGAVDISSDGYLYVDDMVRDRTESLSPTRLDKRYQDYLNVLVDRKNDGSKELVVATRWNVLDILSRLEESNKNNPKARFRKIPALNEKGESNFQYDYGVGFSTEYYKKIEARLDRNEWMAKYMQAPFVREGLLFPLDELNYYDGVLPDGDNVTYAACDIAWGGGDSLSLPFGVVFGNGEDAPIYITDWVFNQGDKDVTKPLVTAKIVQNEPCMVRFEANSGGDEYADDIERNLKGTGFRTYIFAQKASNQIAKMAKIIQYAPDIKRRCYFLKPELQNEEYRNAMGELGMIVQNGKNVHDDSADGITQLIQLIIDNGVAETQYVNSPMG